MWRAGESEEEQRERERLRTVKTSFFEDVECSLVSITKEMKALLCTCRHLSSAAATRVRESVTYNQQIYHFQCLCL